MDEYIEYGENRESITEKKEVERFKRRDCKKIEVEGAILPNIHNSSQRRNQEHEEIKTLY